MKPRLPIYRVSRNKDETVREFTRMFMDIMAMHGIPESPEVQKVCQEKAEEEWKLIQEKLKQNIPSKELLELLKSPKKADAVRRASNLTISRTDFVGLVAQASDLGFEHSIETHEFRPPGLELGSGLFGKPEDFQKDFKKIKTIFSQRKQIFIHTFKNNDQWHIFFFTGSDLSGAHWEAGEHVHYIAWNFGREMEEVMAQLRLKKHSLSDALHIRTKDLVGKSE